MIAIQELGLKGLRCWNELHWQPHEAINLIIGANGTGKTSLLEAIHLVLGLRSLSGSRLDPLIPEGREQGFAQARLRAGQGERLVSIGFSKGQKLVKVDEKRLRHPDEVLRQQAVVPFVPSDLQLVQGGPLSRRKLLDQISFYRHRDHAEHLRRYNQALAARNALLRGRSDPKLLEAWTQELARYGAQIIRARAESAEAFSPLLSQSYTVIAGDHEELEGRYEGSVSLQKDLEQDVLALLNKALRRDKKRGYTSVGPHHEDWSFFLAGRNLRRHASQGQQRTTVLAARLALVDWVVQHRGYRPVLLLDDVAGDLDRGRRQRLFNRLLDSEGQVFITGTGDELKEEFRGRPVQSWHLPKRAELR